MSNEFDALISRLTPDAFTAVASFAHRHADVLGHDQVGACDVLLGVLSINPGSGDINPVARGMKDRFGLSNPLYTLRTIAANKPFLAEPDAHGRYAPSVEKALISAGRQATIEKNRDGFITRFNLGFGIADAADPIVVSVLKDAGIDLESFKEFMRENSYAGVLV